jgi:hypothetical protein
MRALRWIGSQLVTADAIYGLILFSALVAVISTDHSDSWEVFWVSGLSLVVFFVAHVYAGTIANHGVVDGHEVTLGHAFQSALGNSSGMLFASVLPAIPLLLGIAHLLSYGTSVDDSLYVVLVILAVLGYLSFAQRKSKMVVRIFGALGTALFGLAIIILNSAVH